MFRDVKQKWADRKYGVELGYSEASRLTNLRFADDVFLVSHSWQQVTRMLSDVRKSAAAVGLLLHPDKTKIITNATKGTGRGKRTHATVDDMQIEIVPLLDPVKYLGKHVVFEGQVEAEIEHRLRQGWKAFMASKEELTTTSIH
eukprot:9491457-Pyramimonas_sp.AAC.1